MLTPTFAMTPTMVTDTPAPKVALIPSITELANHNTFGLPRLPIPSLETTAANYLQSCKGLAPVTPHTSSTIDEASRLFNAQLDAHSDKLNNFLSTSGPGLHRTLVERDAAAAEKGGYPFSFIENLWDAAYLDDEGPIPFFNSVNMVSKSLDPSLSQARIAAKLARACAKWLIAANDGSLPTPGGKPIEMCMSALPNQFGLARKPGQFTDEKAAAASMAEALRFITVVYKGEVFLVSMVDTVSGQLRSEDSLNDAFTTVMESGKESSDASTSIPIMTAANRRQWFQTRTELCTINPANATNMNLIDHSLIVLCLDSDPVSSALDMQYKLLTGSSPDALSRTPTAARNRWFDKHQLVIPCTPGEGFGFIAEHSFSDGMMWWTWLKDVYGDFTSGGTTLSDPTDRVVVPTMTSGKADSPTGQVMENGVVQLQFSLNESVQGAVSKTLDKHIASINNLSVALTTLPLSKDQSKTVFKISLDGLCLAALQLAFARLHGFTAATYKPASMGKFFHGRTETVRSASPAMNAFIRAFLEGGHSDAEIATLLRAATTAHRELSIAAVSGAGIDRHLYALKTIANEMQDKDALAFFNDDLCKQSGTWTLSTTTNIEPFLEWGSFCPVTPAGYGVSFYWRKDVVNFTATSYDDAEKSGLKTSAIGLTEEVGKVTQELVDVLRKTSAQS